LTRSDDGDCLVHGSLSGGPVDHDQNTTHQETTIRMISTFAPQQGRTAAGARPCSGVLGGNAFGASNASMVMGMAVDAATYEWTHTTSKRRPTRHLGAVPS
jgi:hypothetical protein